MMNSKMVKNQLVELDWAGWRSDTHTLQRNGWQISAQEDMDLMRFRIGIKHPTFGLYGFTTPMDYMRLAAMEDYKHGAFSGYRLQIQAMGANTSFRVIQPVTLGNIDDFVPIDATPAQCTRDFDSLKIFRPLAKEQEIIIPEQNVSELLEKIHSLQDPQQAEIREKRRKAIRKMQRDANHDMNNYQQETNIVAQLATIGG